MGSWCPVFFCCCFLAKGVRSCASSSSSFPLASNAEAVRKESVAASTPSAEASASDATTRRGSFPEERRTVRSLLCGPGSTRLPGRTPGGGVLCPRRASCASCTTSSLALAPVFCPRRAAYCCSSTCFSNGPALWWSAAARAMRTVCCSCRSIERSRRSRRRRAAPVGCPLSSAIVRNAKTKGHKPV